MESGYLNRIVISHMNCPCLSLTSFFFKSPDCLKLLDDRGECIGNHSDHDEEGEEEDEHGWHDELNISTGDTTLLLESLLAHP